MYIINKCYITFQVYLLLTVHLALLSVSGRSTLKEDLNEPLIGYRPLLQGWATLNYWMRHCICTWRRIKSLHSGHWFRNIRLMMKACLDDFMTLLYRSRARLGEHEHGVYSPLLYHIVASIMLSELLICLHWIRRCKSSSHIPQRTRI